MLRSQKLDIKSVEIRGRLSELAGLESLEEDQRIELKEKTAELRQVEEQRVASLEVETLEGEQAEKRDVLGDVLDPEERERQEILGKARLGNAIQAVIDGRPLQGAESELRSAYRLSGDHEIPHELFEPREARAATDAPATGTQVNEQPVQPFIYKEGVAGFLGIDMPQVGGGTASHPVLTTGTPAGMKAKGAAADETEAAFTISTSTPKRVTGSFRVRVEDMALFPQLEDSLRRDIPMSLANAVEEQILNGDGSAPNITGLLERLTDPDEAMEKHTPGPTSRQSQDPWMESTDTPSVIFGLWQGRQPIRRWHPDISRRTAVSTASYLDTYTGGVRMSDRIPDVAEVRTIQPGIVRLGMRPMCAVSVVWGGVTLIRDIYSGAASGEIVVTALQLIGDVHVLRDGSFAEVSFYP